MVFGLWFRCSPLRVGFTQMCFVWATKTKQSYHLQLDPRSMPPPFLYFGPATAASEPVVVSSVC